MFSWDARKAARNLEKYGVSFEEAATVFIDSEGLDWQDLEHSQTEKRYKRLGLSIRGKVLLVVYTPRRTKNGKEVIRLIGARQASRKERNAYSRRQD